MRALTPLAQPWRISDELLSDTHLPIPLRPPPRPGEAKEVQERHEEEAFAAWREQLRELPAERLNYFEQNVEVRGRPADGVRGWR